MSALIKSNIPGIIAVIIIGVLSANSLHSAYKHLPVQEVHVQYAADFSDDKILMGASHNVFVGKVTKQVGTEERGIGPETQFEVEIIDNIKGNLKGTIVVNQQGGYKDGVLYVVEGDIGTPVEQKNSYLLQPGSTYILATRYNENKNWYTLNSHPAASKLLTNSRSSSASDLKVLATNDQRSQQLQVAYQHEILLAADIERQNTLNSYKDRKIERPKVAPSTVAEIIKMTSPPDVMLESGQAGSTKENALPLNQ